MSNPRQLTAFDLTSLLEFSRLYAGIENGTITVTEDVMSSVTDPVLKRRLIDLICLKQAGVKDG